MCDCDGPIGYTWDIHGRYVKLCLDCGKKEYPYEREVELKK